MTDTNLANASLQDDSKIALLQEVVDLNWQDYYQRLTLLPAPYELSASLKLLNVVDQLMNQTDSEGLNNFSSSSLVERFLIGGVEDSQTAKQYGFNTQLLGSMQGFGSFKKVLKNDPEGLAKLLKIIPASGGIDGWHFTQFVEAYQALFATNGFKQTHLFPATRLLAMKRPDQFVTISLDTLDFICQAFAIKTLKKQDFQRYWDEIILTLHKSPWFNEEQPEDMQQAPIFRSRMALFERFICQPDEDYMVSVPVVESTIELSPNDSVESDNSNVKVSTYVSEPATKPVKKKISQPKKMTIDKKKSAKVNKNAATKLMSQYYFANKEKFAKMNMSANRDKIIAKLIDGESVEKAFDQVI